VGPGDGAEGLLPTVLPADVFATGELPQATNSDAAANEAGRIKTATTQYGFCMAPFPCGMKG
jgi:hypothetical protein